MIGAISPRDKLFADALALSDADRAELAAELIDSLDGQDSEASQAWIQEIETRARAVADGSAELLDYDDVMAELRSLDRE